MAGAPSVQCPSTIMSTRLSESHPTPSVALPTYHIATADLTTATTFSTVVKGSGDSKEGNVGLYEITSRLCSWSYANVSSARSRASLVECYSNRIQVITRISIQTAGLAFCGTGLRSYPVMGLLQLRYEHDSSTIRLRFERDTTSYEELCAFEQ